MRAFSYDLHIHSCLSPCGDDEATPNSIAGLASLIGLEILALTDHNTTRNCPAFFEAAARYGIIPVGGMELTTSEDVHMVCLFPTLEAAMDFGAEVEKRRILVPNRREIFGNQRILDADDVVIGEEENLLINATTLSLEEGAALAARFGGVAFPAHIDRESNGIIAVLGSLPESPYFPTVELHDGTLEGRYRREQNLGNRRVIVSSDAHRLEDLSEAEHFLHLEGDPADPQSVRDALMELLSREQSERGAD